MMLERTLIMIKPRTFEENVAGNILSMIQAKGFKIVACKVVKLSKKQAEEFYYVHKGKVFYEGLTKFMSAGEIMVAVLEGENIIARMRELMGKTNPEDAAEGTIRKLYGHNLRENAIHGSDSVKSAEYEIGFFFSKQELIRE